MRGGWFWDSWVQSATDTAKNILPTSMTSPTIQANALDIPVESTPPPAEPSTETAPAAGGRRKTKKHSSKRRRGTRKH